VEWSLDLDSGEMRPEEGLSPAVLERFNTTAQDCEGYWTESPSKPRRFGDSEVNLRPTRRRRVLPRSGLYFDEGAGD